MYSTGSESFLFSLSKSHNMLKPIGLSLMCSIGMSDPSRTNTALLRSIIMEWVICRSLIEGMRQPFASEYDDFLVGVGAANAECQNERRESHHSIIPRSVASIMETVASANGGRKSASTIKS